jgi:hypothetical protein
VPESGQIWMAYLGPDTPALGEMKENQVYQNQIAKTLSALLELVYTPERPVGNLISNVIMK